MSEVRGSSREYQTATAQEQLRGATLRLRSRWAAERRYPASEVRGCNKRSYPASEVRGGGRECYRALEARDSGREDQPHIQGAVAAWAQEGLEELSHVEGQERRR